ncbi:hypothetical protein ONA91_10550 [Micromonospora sp. DR5-3]|uniref:hypothetical protein n=1 Tax=unclassified Micromonospora TaxID=2617518 RepID=UPI0011D87586|nr:MULTISPECIES: hypothetical protein [unclassified Micromonospora]MCW3814893.1 hypothetical protein [Micromonospora sp. DR5-3]TYC24199.1 hypothetical protein FXF52_12045 [Micromonospora sp. MP36]
MARRVVVALLAPVAWTPPGIDPTRWRTALAEDVVDLLATLNEVETAVAVTPGDRWLADAVVWPGTAVYEVPEPTVNAVFAALAGTDRAAAAGADRAAAAGTAERAHYDQAAVVVADAPDVPGLTLGKLLRPLSSRPVAVAPVEDGVPGLLGVAARLPVPDWLPVLDLETAAPAEVRAAAPRPGDVAVTVGWRRLRGPADLAVLDPAVEGWEATRALLSAQPH